MTEAVIIPFPAPAPVLSEQERLRQALCQLDTALSDQRHALREWRFAMAELNIGVSGLCLALGSYQESLGDVQQGVEALRGEARKLEAWADSVIAAER